MKRGDRFAGTRLPWLALVTLIPCAMSAAQAPGVPQPAAISFSELQAVVGFPDYWRRETKYQVKD